MRTTAGRAFPTEWRIDLNPHLWERVGATFPQDTIGHEVAHLVDWKLTGTTNHGDGWQRIMLLFALTPEATHDWDVSDLRRRTRHYLYTCACAEPHRLGPIRHRRIQRGAVYLCRRCRERLEPINPADRAPAWR